MRFLSFILLGSILTSCAISGKTIRDVPMINPKNIPVSALSALPKRNLSLQVIDERKDKNQSSELLSEISRAVTEALTREGTTVSTPGANDLTLTVQEYETEKFKEGCVKIVASITIPKKAKLGAEASSCFESKSPFGQKIGANIGKAYEEALTLIFKNLDQGLAKIQPN